MFIKQLKYDFLFSAKTFLALFAGMVVLSVVVRLAGVMPNSSYFPIEMIRMMLLILGATAIAIGSYFEILRLYYRNFFGAEGYLMLTLPVSRASLLASKFIVSFVWFCFMMLTLPIIIFVVEPPHNGVLNAIGDVLSNPNFYIMAVEIGTLALALISFLFLTITLANSVVLGKKIHGIAAGIMSAILHVLFFLPWGMLPGRFMEVQFVEWVSQSGHITSFYGRMPLLGLQYGRIPWGSWAVEYPTFGPNGGYIDIFRMGYALAFAVAATLLIMHLLKKRIALR